MCLLCLFGRWEEVELMLLRCSPMAAASERLVQDPLLCIAFADQLKYVLPSILNPIAFCRYDTNGFPVHISKSLSCTP